MDKVYVITFECSHHFDDNWDADYNEKSVLGVFDTEMRAMCYLRRFLKEDDDMQTYHGHTMQSTETREGCTSAKAWRRYRSDNELITETIEMECMKMNGIMSPNDDIMNLYM